MSMRLMCPLCGGDTNTGGQCMRGCMQPVFPPWEHQTAVQRVLTEEDVRRIVREELSKVKT